MPHTLCIWDIFKDSKLTEVQESKILAIVIVELAIRSQEATGGWKGGGIKKKRRRKRKEAKKQSSGKLKVLG